MKKIITLGLLLIGSIVWAQHDLQQAVIESAPVNNSKFMIKGNGLNETIKLPDDTFESLYRIDLTVVARVRF